MVHKEQKASLSRRLLAPCALTCLLVLRAAQLPWRGLHRAWHTEVAVQAGRDVVVRAGRASRGLSGLLGLKLSQPLVLRAPRLRSNSHTRAR